MFAFVMLRAKTNLQLYAPGEWFLLMFQSAAMAVMLRERITIAILDRV